MLSINLFNNPPAEYRPIPFWFWNSKMRKSEIEAQIRDFHDKGLGGFFIHARFGLETEYLSHEWIDCVRHAVEVAKELGMEVWLYDENGFPSGIGDLKVSRIREYRSHFIDLTEKEIRSGEEVEITLPEGEVLMAYAFSEDDRDKRIDLMPNISENTLKWKAPQGKWHIAVYTKGMLEDPNDTVFGVDYLNPQAMRFFLDFTLTPYADALKEHFGKTVKGVFTDEPTLLPWHHNLGWYGQRKNGRVVVWDDRIEPEMISRHNLRAEDFLPHLFFDIDESTPEVRKAFWRVVIDLYVKAFFEPYAEWCEKHNLKFTGHVLLEEGLYLNTDFQADITESLSRMHIPGTDHLGESTEVRYGGFSNLPQQLTNIQGEKLVVSTAHCAGRNTIISETYGCAGWGLRFERMKWIADWQYSLGINMLCPHAFFYSIEGFRKSDAPPSENHMAGWKYYRKFADYIGRLSYMLRSGRHVAKVALLYPLREFWEKHIIGQVGERDRKLSDWFDLCASLLLRLHFDYDIISEQALESAQIINGKIRIANEEYEVLIMPAPAISGHDIMSASVPVVSGHPCPETMKIITPEIGREDIDASMLALDKALREMISPDVEIKSADGEALPDIRYMHREVDGKHIYFVANTTDRYTRAVIDLEQTGAVEIWNPETGEVLNAEGVSLNNMRLSIDCNLVPYGSTFYLVDNDKPVQSTLAIKKNREELLVLPDEWEFDIEGPNSLMLKNLEFYPLAHGIGSGYEYRTSFTCEYVPDDLMLMLDDIEYRNSLMGGMDLTIEINEQKWVHPEMGWYWDKGFKTLNISSAVVRGKNDILIKIGHSAWSGHPHLLSSPPVLLGSFGLGEDALTLVSPVKKTGRGSWTDFGYPYYSGSAIYTQSFFIPAGTSGKRIFVNIADVKDMVEIVINGKTADIRLWQPWNADITDFLINGTNKLSLRVTNSASNFLEANPRPSGLMGKVRLIAINHDSRTLGL